MPSLNTLALREAQSALRVSEIPVEMPPVEPNTHVAVAVEMRRRSYLLNVQRSQRTAATNKGRAIPVGGPGRRRAKAQRNKRAVTGLLADVLAYCDTHPNDGPLPDPEPVILHRNASGTITVEGAVPDVIDVTCMLLESPFLRGLDFVDGVLSIRVLPKPLRYRPLGRSEFEFAVRFERIRDEA